MHADELSSALISKIRWHLQRWQWDGWVVNLLLRVEREARSDEDGKNKAAAPLTLPRSN